MERLCLLRFGYEQPNTDYFMCRRCTARIAFREHFHSVSCFHGVHTGFFNTAVNVQEDQAVHHWQSHDSHTLAIIYCVLCGDILGFKIVQAAPGQTYSQNGMVNIYLDKLSRRRGNEILSGHELRQQIIENEIEVESIVHDQDNNGRWGARVTQ